MKTLILVLLDESGSMQAKLGDVIGGYNSFMKGQRAVAVEGEVSVTFLKFNTKVTTVLECEPVEKVPDLTNVSYVPGGCTALYDAVKEGVRVAERNGSGFDRFVCVIMTDGAENASRETTKDQVRKIITGKEAQGNWTFLYIGEDPERWARDMGQSVGNVARYDLANQRANFEAANLGVQQLVQTCHLQAPSLLQYPSFPPQYQPSQFQPPIRPTMPVQAPNLLQSPSFPPQYRPSQLQPPPMVRPTMPVPPTFKKQ